MGRFKDLTNSKFGNLKVLKKVKKENNPKVFWLCICDCGNEKIVVANSLIKGNTNHCGCIKKKPKKKREVEKGTEFGRWKVLETTEEKMVKCQCKCGTKREVNKINLLCNSTTSCGCLIKELNHNRLANKAHLNKRLNHIYNSMKSRCRNKNNKAYKYYGAKGIKVCPEWLENYDSFYDWAMNNGYEEGLSIDRIKVKGDYEPSNCRWATRTTQARNKSNSIYVSIMGVSKHVSEWDNLLGLRPRTTYNRKRSGWDEATMLLPTNSPIKKELEKYAKEKNLKMSVIVDAALRVHLKMKEENK